MTYSVVAVDKSPSDPDAATYNGDSTKLKVSAFQPIGLFTKAGIQVFTAYGGVTQKIVAVHDRRTTPDTRFLLESKKSLTTFTAVIPVEAEGKEDQFETPEES